MSYDRYDVEFHLTPHGWHKGSSWYYGDLQKRVKPPENRLLTVKKCTEQSSGWSPVDVGFSVEWSKPGAEKQIEKLKKEFPLQGFC